MAEVSIIVPVYNVEKYLERCLDSLINQTFKDIEIICIDDGSIDNSGKILDEYAAKDSRIKVIHQNNAGLSVTRNNGMKIASGNYINFVDSDDWIDLNFIEKLYDAAKRNNADIAVSDCLRIGNGRTKHRLNITKEVIAFNFQEKFDLCKQKRHPSATNKLYRVDILTSNNIFFPEGKFCEDKIFTCKAIFYAKSVVGIPGTYYYYYRRPGSIVKTYSKKIQEDKYCANETVLQFLRSVNAEINEDSFCITKKEVKVLKIPLYKIKENLKFEKILLFNFIPIYKINIEKKKKSIERRKLRKEFKIKSNKKIEISPYYATNYNSKSNIDLITIAFNNSLVIDYQIKLIKKNIKGSYLHIICDNSNDFEKAIAIKNICKNNDITYIHVTIKKPSGYSDSHGRALNWVWENIILRRKNNFGFIDHDIFPIKNIDINSYLCDRDLYGFVRHANNIWWLWPAYSFFKYEYVKEIKLNFRKYKKFSLFHYKGADSGSGNWSVLYKNYDITKLFKVDSYYIDVLNDCPPRSIMSGYDSYIQTNLSQYMDNESWFHSICASEWSSNVAEKNLKIYKLLEDFLSK